MCVLVPCVYSLTISVYMQLYVCQELAPGVYTQRELFTLKGQNLTTNPLNAIWRKRFITYIYMCVCVCIHIYIHIYRHAVCVYTHIYIYMYRHADINFRHKNWWTYILVHRENEINKERKKMKQQQQKERGVDARMSDIVCKTYIFWKLK